MFNVCWFKVFLLFMILICISRCLFVFKFMFVDLRFLIEVDIIRIVIFNVLI